MSRIISPGSLARPALIDVSEAILVECKQVLQPVALEATPLEWLPYIIGRPRSLTELKALMKRRYVNLRPEWNTGAGGPIAVCVFELLGSGMRQTTGRRESLWVHRHLTVPEQ